MKNLPTTKSLYDMPAFIQEGLWGQQDRYYRFENNLGALVRVGESQIILQTLQFFPHSSAWRIAGLRGIRSGSIHTLEQAEITLKQIKDFPWGD